ncbi:phage tail sheath subtilisin-like domain-containing protein [Cytobacillus kochii]|uniref:phage tail sheath subtilisin-like domain-containing protein n=1 Tax=Cytobacillus kochii TaxID=859143 RepID=UPI00402A8B28
MAGTYIEGVSKVLSGVYTLIKAAVQRISVGSRGVVAYPFTSNWGPVNQIVDIGNEADFRKVFNGDKTSLTASLIFKLAFAGRPQRVKAYRMAVGSAAKGTATLSDINEAPAITLETLYPTDRTFTAVVKDGFTPSEKVIDILEGSVLLASVKGTSVDQLVRALNGTDYVRVVSSDTNMPNNTAGVTFTEGSNGDSVTAAEYTAFTEALEAEEGVNAFSLDGVTDEAIIAAMVTFTKRVREDGLYITFVNGGPTSWDVSPGDANAKSNSLNYRAIVNVGNGADGFNGAEAAIYVAARVASAELNAGLTDELTPFATVNKKLTKSERIAAKEAGTLVFVTEGDQVVIDEAVNTLTAPVAGESKEMGKIRVNNTLDQISYDLEKFGNEYKRGRSNTDEARQTFAAAVETDYLGGLAAMEVIQPDYSYEPDPDYHGESAVFKPALDEAYFTSVVTPVDSMEKIYQKIGVNF